MPRITYIEFDGTRHEVDAETGVSLMEAARANDVPGIVGECGGAAACAPCHVIVDDQWLPITGAASGSELELLECVGDEVEGSRLSCQVELTAELDGLVVRVPETQA